MALARSSPSAAWRALTRGTSTCAWILICSIRGMSMGRLLLGATPIAVVFRYRSLVAGARRRSARRAFELDGVAVRVAHVERRTTAFGAQVLHDAARARARRRQVRADRLGIEG